MSIKENENDDKVIGTNLIGNFDPNSQKDFQQEIQEATKNMVCLLEVKRKIDGVRNN